MRPDFYIREDVALSVRFSSVASCGEILNRWRLACQYYKLSIWKLTGFEAAPPTREVGPISRAVRWSPDRPNRLATITSRRDHSRIALVRSAVKLT